MSYKTVLVQQHDPRRQRALLGVAAQLASSFEGHLVGLTVLPPIIVIPGTEAGGATVIEEHRDAYRREIGTLKATFEATTRGEPFVAEWREVDAGYDDGVLKLIEHGRSADIVVVSTRDPGWGYSDQLEAPERVALESGRPVLIVPSIAAPTIGRRVLVAWNGRREAARAVFDALPLLKRAEQVIVVWVNPQDEAEVAGDLPGFDICTALARQGVRCEATQNIRPAGNVGATLLSTVRSNAADLLVMGCYGHTRLREMVFGGATRHVLEHTTVPVLMSH